MFDEIKDTIRQLVETNPSGYSTTIRFKYPELCQWLKDTYPSRGEGLYRWLYGISPPLCTECKAVECKFNSIHNGGYREFCSCSCRAKYNKSYKNAHDSDGGLKQSAKDKNSEKAPASQVKRLATYSDKTGGRDMHSDIVATRARKYQEKIPPELKDIEYCKKVKVPLDELARQLKVPYSMVLNHFREHGLTQQNVKISKVSKAESSVCQLLDALGVSYVQSVTNVLSKRRELDIYIPELNLAIEYCGLFWHSDRNNYSPSKHQEKFLECQQLGIKLITLFEDEWLFKREIVESRIRSLVGKNVRLFARKCTVGVAETEVATVCLNQWHIQGAKSSSRNVSLYSEGDVVAILTYGKPRYGSEDIEIIRYATKPGITVVGGFSKLLKAMQTKVGIGSIVSYSDNRWGSGGVYRMAGMEYDGITQPSYYYFIPAERKRYHRSTFMKHKIVANMGGDPLLTEVQNMHNFGYNRIFDCGTSRWVMRAPPVVLPDAVC